MTSKSKTPLAFAPLVLALAGLLALLPIGKTSTVEAQAVAPTPSCSTAAVRMNLSSEQFTFCPPTALLSSAVEDSTSSPAVAYAQWNQNAGYGIVNIKSVAFGSSPGIGMPFYQQGKLDQYRQEIWNLESSKSGFSVSNGPPANIWGVQTPSIQIDTTLSTSQGSMTVRSLEWFLEHNHRLWAVIMSWDMSLQNADEWLNASNNFALESPVTSAADTAINLGSAYLKSQSAPKISTLSAPQDVGTPAWWNGICDDVNYYAKTGVHSTPLGSSWHGVPSCGPRPYTVSTPDNLVRFFSGSYGAYEFECVELVMRFLYQEWGIAPFAGNGNTIKNNYSTSSMIFYNNGSSSLIPGDVLTENSSAQNSFGHTAVITAVNVDSTGTGTITILEQNASPSGSRSLNVTNWSVGPDAYAYGQTIQGWLHALNNTSNPLSFAKTAPSNGAKAQTINLALSWAPSTGASSYEYCMDTINNNSCDTSWVSTTAQTAAISGLLNNTTYYWQVRAVNSNGDTYADSNTWWSFNTKLAAPTGLIPSNATTLLNLRPTWSWNAVNGASNYTLQVASTSAFSKLQINANVLSTTFTSGNDLPVLNSYYWRVRSNGTNGPSDWSIVQTFTTSQPPSIPILSSPNNNTLVANYAPTLLWKSVTLPLAKTFDHYRIQVAKDKSFASPIDANTAVGDVSAVIFTPTSNLDPNTTYYWRVSAYDSDGDYSSWSAIRSFRTRFLPPVPLSPADDSATSVLTNRPTFTWSDPNTSGVTGYTIQFSKSSTFSSIVMTGNSNVATYTPSADLPGNTVLYWRLLTKGNNGPSAWSAPGWAFLTGNPPSVPVLLSPSNKALSTNYNNPVFTWKTSSVPLGVAFQNYEIQIAADSTFASLLADDPATIPSYPSNLTLNPNTTYYWRVRAFNTANDFSGWSTIWVLRAALLPPTLSLPVNNATSVPPKPTFSWSDPNTMGVQGYKIQISTNNAFTSIVASGSPSTANYTPSKLLPSGTTLYWRVEVTGPNGPSLWSATGTFTTQ